jgi:cytochrome c oxidase cbb3-type subunit 1
MAVQQIMRMQPGQSGSERVQHEDIAVKWALWAGVGYLCLFGLIGFIAAVKFVIPDLFGPINWLSWPRIRPAHVQGMIFGWLLPIYMSMFYYIVPRLTGTKLWSEKLGIASVCIWAFGVIWATFWLLNPTDSLNPYLMTKGKEYEEYDLVANGFLLVGWILLFINMMATFARRTYTQMYVGLWYIMGCLMWTAFVYVIGNWPSQVLPQGWGAGFKGLNDANINWFYGHSVVGLIATPGGLGIAYYILPKVTNAPIYSHKLSLIGFWTLGAIYIWNGAHHMIYGPIPYWLQTVATIFSFLLFIPVLALVTNFFGTVRGEWHQLRSNVPLKFIIAGTVFYLLVSTQGSFQALRSLNAVTHFTDWVIGHAHMALFGTFTFYAYAAAYYVVPRAYKKPLYSEGMADWHFWLSFIGFILFSTALWIGGYYQGLLWNDPSIPFIKTVDAVKPFWHARAGGGFLMLTGMILFAFNLIRTALGPAPAENTDGGTSVTTPNSPLAGAAA